MSSLVSQTPPACAERALQYFSQRLAFETDCSDVYTSQQQGNVDFVLVDVRNEAAFATLHLPGAINIPHRLMDATLLSLCNNQFQGKLSTSLGHNLPVIVVLVMPTSWRCNGWR